MGDVTRRSVQFREWSLTLSEEPMSLGQLAAIVAEASAHLRDMKEIHGPEAELSSSWMVSPEYPAETMVIRVTVEVPE